MFTIPSGCFGAPFRLIPLSLERGLCQPTQEPVAGLALEISSRLLGVAFVVHPAVLARAAWPAKKDRFFCCHRLLSAAP